MTADVPSWAATVGGWCAVVLAVAAVLGLLFRWFVVPAMKEALRTDFAPVIGEVVATQLSPFVERLTAVEAVLGTLNTDLRRHMDEENRSRT